MIPAFFPKMGVWRASVNADDVSVVLTEIKPIARGFNIGAAKELRVTRTIHCADSASALAVATAINAK